MSTWPQRFVIRTIAAWMVVAPTQAWAERTAVDQTLWDDVLARYVHDGRVDYAGLMTSRASLESYLYDVAQAVPEDFRSREEQLAFWINAYNACVLKGVLDHYPIPSVKRIAGFFDRILYRIAGRELTLNQIESAGRALGDWRIHMALVCASASCPPLRAEAYVPERLEEQLTDQARRFLNDSKRGLRLEGSTLWLSSIFSWYAGDFVASSRRGLRIRLTPEAFIPIIAAYLDPELAEAVKTHAMHVKFLEYDWSLNALGQTITQHNKEGTP